MSKLASIMALASMGTTYPAMPFIDLSSPIFIPRKHPIQSYADHKRAKQKRKNRRGSR